MPWKLNDAEVPTSKGFKFEKSGNWFTSPRNWFDVWGDSDKEAAGLVWQEPPARSSEEKLEELRRRRNAFLTMTDWRGVSDLAPMADAWKTYRQQLRDITKTATSLDDVVWPSEPS